MPAGVISGHIHAGVYRSVWTDLANGQTGDSSSLSGFADKTVQVSGTFGVGGSVTIQGSNDGANWNTLTDPLGNDLIFTAAEIAVIAQNPLHVRPIVTAGDGTTAIDVVVIGTGRA